MRYRPLFAVGVGTVLLVAFAAEARACHWWGRQHRPMYAPVGPPYNAPAPAYYAPPMYAAPRVQYAPAPGAYVQPGMAPAAPSRPVTAITVGARDNAFEPAALHVPPGTTVRWTNYGQHPHTVTDRGGKFDSGDIAPGGTYSATFQTPGTYHYYCKHHKGMEATIVVGEPGKGPATNGGGAKGTGY